MKASRVVLLAIVCLLGMALTGCVTNTMVRIESDPPGASVFIDGNNLGETPVRVRMSNAVWEDPDLVLKKEGYRDLFVAVDKEVKGINLISGLLLWTPSLLWCYGPDAYQYYKLTPENK